MKSKLMPIIVVAAALSLGLTVGALAQEPDPSRQAEAQRLCDTYGRDTAAQHGRVDSLLAAHASTPQRFAQWEENRFGSSGPRPQPLDRAESGSNILALCYYAGDFPVFPRQPRPADAGPDWTAPAWTRLGLTVDQQGKVVLYVLGLNSTIDPQQDRPA